MITNAPALRFDGRVRAGQAVLAGPVTLEAPAGRWTCLLGPSGVGKSTLLQCFAGLTDGLDIEGQVQGPGGRVALMAQSDGLLPWLSLVANVTLGDRLRHRRPDPERAEALLARVGLGDLLRRRPGALSGGQRQRAALARTLYEDSPVVLLDEPFSALDVATRAKMQDLAAAELAGRTVLHVTHDPAEAARLGDHILVMTARGIHTVTGARDPIPRAPDAPDTLAITGQLTRHLLEAA